MSFAMNKITLASAFVLHRRAFRESSFLVELFSEEFGRFSVVAKGVKRASNPAPGLLQPFNPLLISCAGKTELLALSQTELSGQPIGLSGDFLYAGLYLNELLMRLLHKWDTYPLLFKDYHETLHRLNQNQPIEQVLRSFEKCLLEELGYAIWPRSEQAICQAFQPEKFYQFSSENGWQIAQDHHLARFSGKNLIAMAKEEWHNAECLLDAKRLIRIILQPLLGDKPLYSRKLFM